MAYEKLFEPIQIGKATVKNRFAYAPTNLFYNWEGTMTEQEVAYYTARAMGGIGMVIVGAYLSTEFGVPYAQHPFMNTWHIRFVQPLAKLADNIRLAGATAVCQLLPVPSQYGHNWTDTQPVSPSAGMPFERPERGLATQRLHKQRIPNSWRAHKFGSNAPDEEAREITIEEIQRVIKENTYSCKIAALAGFDGIELHMCHIYLVNAFRDPRLNRRTDRYGGSEENRHRLLLEIAEAGIRAAKEENPNIFVGVRLNPEGHEGRYQKYGYPFEETKRLALRLQELGIDYYHETSGGQFRLPDEKLEEDGHLLKYSKELKKILKIPVITPTVHDPKLAEQAIAEGQTDLVSNARQFIADPEFVNKLKEGREKDIIKCTRCMMCGRGGLVNGIYCIENPETGREYYNPKYWITKGFTGAAYMHPALQKK